jgi:NADH-quinone oxidoreductase subunit L
MPLTFVTFTIGVLAIIGLPFLAGFFSKDAILYLAMENNTRSSPCSPSPRC